MAYKFLFDMGFWQGYYTRLVRSFGAGMNADKIAGKKECGEENEPSESYDRKA